MRDRNRLYKKKRKRKRKRKRKGDDKKKNSRELHYTINTIHTTLDVYYKTTKVVMIDNMDLTGEGLVLASAHCPEGNALWQWQAANINHWKNTGQARMADGRRQTAGRRRTRGQAGGPSTLHTHEPRLQTERPEDCYDRGVRALQEPCSLIVHFTVSQFRTLLFINGLSFSCTVLFILWTSQAYLH
jgi:hypothetical protein